MFCIVRIIELVGLAIPTLLHPLNLFFGPTVHRQALDFRDVGAQLAMDSSAFDADEDTQVPGGPTWVTSSAVSANLIAGLF